MAFDCFNVGMCTLEELVEEMDSRGYICLKKHTKPSTVDLDLLNDLAEEAEVAASILDHPEEILTPDLTKLKTLCERFLVASGLLVLERVEGVPEGNDWYLIHETDEDGFGVLSSVRASRYLSLGGFVAFGPIKLPEVPLKTNTVDP